MSVDALEVARDLGLDPRLACWMTRSGWALLGAADVLGAPPLATGAHPLRRRDERAALRALRGRLPTRFRAVASFAPWPSTVRDRSDVELHPLGAYVSRHRSLEAGQARASALNRREAREPGFSITSLRSAEAVV